MIKWCSYCQKFQGEVEPYNSFDITHGICLDCAAQGLGLSEESFARVQNLQALQNDLMKAGESGDVAQAEMAITRAESGGTRAIDIFMGLIAPALYRVGELWESGLITTADEHRFTAVYSSLLTKFKARGQSRRQNELREAPEALLINAPGNDHTVGLDLLEEWLLSEGKPVRVLETGLSLEAIRGAIKKFRPRYFGISVALLEQLNSARGLISDLTELAQAQGMTFVLGGNPVKRGMVTSFPEAKMGVSFFDGKSR